jgi:hypothetical protein
MGRPGGGRSDAALAFIDKLPKIESLMPALSFEAVCRHGFFV